VTGKNVCGRSEGQPHRLFPEGEITALAVRGNGRNISISHTTIPGSLVFLRVPGRKKK